MKGLFNRSSGMASRAATPTVALDHATQRLKRAGLSGLSAIIAQGLSVVVSFISVPLTVGYLGAELYGVWITLSSLLTWLLISDLGLGSALVNGIAEANGRSDEQAARELVATSFWVLALIAAGLTIVSIPLLFVIDWGLVFGVSSPVSALDLRIAVALALGLLYVSLPVSVTDSVYRGYQQGYKASLWQIVGIFFSFVALLLVVRVEGGLTLLIFALLGTRTALRVLNLFAMFLIEKTHLFPWPNLVHRSRFRRLWRLGGFYVIQQLGNIGMFNAQPIILAQMQGSLAVAQFNVTQKIVTIPVQALFVALPPFIGAYGEARAQGDWSWIHRTAVRVTLASFVGTAALTATIAVLTPMLMSLWIGRGIVADGSLIVWLAVYVIATGVSGPLAVLLQGLERARDIAVFTLLNGITTVLLGLLWAPVYGPTGVAASMAVGVILINCIAQALLIRQILRTHV